MTLKCATCGIADEDYTHLWNCPNNTELVYNTVKAVTITTYREQFEFDFRENEQTLLDILTRGALRIQSIRKSSHPSEK